MNSSAVGVLLVAALLVLGAGSASAAFPGINGKIAFNGNETGNFDIYSVNPDATGLTNLTNDPASDVFPAWSPNGERIAFASRGRPGRQQPRDLRDERRRHRPAAAHQQHRL
jgi:hypothetical protein